MSSLITAKIFWLSLASLDKIFHGFINLKVELAKTVASVLSMFRIFLVIFVAVFLSGCESMRLSQVFSLPAIDQATDKSVGLDQETSQLLTDQLNEFISTAKKGEIARIEQSPWAKNHDIMALEFYHSAGGSKCRVLRLLHGRKDLPDKQYVCAQRFGNWIPIRCITK